MRRIERAIQRWSCGRLTSMEAHNLSKEVARAVEEVLNERLHWPTGVTGMGVTSGPGVTGPDLFPLQGVLIREIMRELD